MICSLDKSLLSTLIFHIDSGRQKNFTRGTPRSTDWELLTCIVELRPTRYVVYVLFNITQFCMHFGKKLETAQMIIGKTEIF